MDRFNGTAARQLDLLDDGNAPILRRDTKAGAGTSLRLLRKDVYAELTRRRRRAQIAAHRLLVDGRTAASDF
jgi:hypothetical protein